MLTTCPYASRGGHEVGRGMRARASLSRRNATMFFLMKAIVAST
jgi:hypothetical protein